MRTATALVLLAACTGSTPSTEQLGSATSACTSAGAGDGFVAQSFPAQTGRFRVELAATPSADDIDAVIALSDGAPTRFQQLATTVRFSPAGVIDVRQGDAYGATYAYEYHGGSTYRFRLDADVATHTYSVWVSFPTQGTPDYYSDYYLIADNVAFRTEQQSVAQLDTIAPEVDSATGGLEVCGFTLQPTGGGATGCTTTSAGDGFRSQPINGGSSLVIADFVATPSAANIDAVIALSAAPASNFTDLAAIVRFAPDGRIDVRNGTLYQGDGELHYVAGAPYRFRIVADAASHLYTVMLVRPDQTISGSVAWGYNFRIEQNQVASLGQLVTQVDSATGSVDLCEVASSSAPQLGFAVPGGSAVWLDGDHALAGVTGYWRLVDQHGTQQQAFGQGAAAIAPDGRIYFAMPYLDHIELTSYTPDGIQELFDRSYPINSSTGIGGFGVTTWGDVILLTSNLADAARPITGAWFFNPDGTLRLTAPHDAAHGAVGRTGYTLTRGRVLDHYNRNGGLEWESSVVSDVVAIAVDRATGAMALGEANGWVNKMTEDGGGGFTGPSGFTSVDAVAVDGQRLVAAGQPMGLRVFDNTGTQTASYDTFGLSDNPNANIHPTATPDLTVGPTGRIYWSMEATWQGPAWSWLVEINP